MALQTPRLRVAFFIFCFIDCNLCKLQFIYFLQFFADAFYSNCQSLRFYLVKALMNVFVVNIFRNQLSNYHYLRMTRLLTGGKYIIPLDSKSFHKLQICKSEAIYEDSHEARIQSIFTGQFGQICVGEALGNNGQTDG